MKILYTVLLMSISFIAYNAPALLESDPTVQYAGIVRSDTPGNWFLIEDANHGSVGLTLPRCDSTNKFLILDFSSFPTGRKILSATTQVDETLVVNGIDAGPSVGIDKIHIKFSKNGVAINCNHIDLSKPYANLWVTVTFIDPPT